METVK